MSEAFWVGVPGIENELLKWPPTAKASHTTPTRATTQAPSTVQRWRAQPRPEAVQQTVEARVALGAHPV